MTAIFYEHAYYTMQVWCSGEIVAEDISYEEFLTRFDGKFVEWVNGCVVKMASIDRKHDTLSRFLDHLFSAYLLLAGGGTVVGDPMVMRLRAHGPARATDLQVLLPHHLDRLKENEVVGAPDLVVEIVSPDSERRDRVEKFSEYESGGVPEYWILDHRYREVMFYHRNWEGFYCRIQPDANGVYHSKVLPRLRLRVDLLWQDSLPNIFEVQQMVEAMFAES